MNYILCYYVENKTVKHIKVKPTEGPVNPQTELNVKALLILIY